MNNSTITQAPQAMKSPSIVKGIAAAYQAAADGDAKTQNLADFLTPHQLARLDREGVAQGFVNGAAYVEKFVNGAIQNLARESQTATA